MMLSRDLENLIADSASLVAQTVSVFFLWFINVFSFDFICETKEGKGWYVCIVEKPKSKASSALHFKLTVQCMYTMG